MVIVQDKLVSEDVLTEQFACNLNACKGACCWEGDFGAPLDTAELHTLEHIFDEIKPFLTPEGLAVIEEEGPFVYYDEAKEYGTPLLKNGACVYLTRDKNTGIAKCGIEQAYEAGKTDFLKPISCHLYPIRIKEDKKTNFEALNYDRWDICSAACEKGKQEKIAVYEFGKNALIRKYGEAFYDELAAAASYLEDKS